MGLPKLGAAPKAGAPPKVGFPPKFGLPPNAGDPPNTGAAPKPGDLAKFVGEPKPVWPTPVPPLLKGPDGVCGLPKEVFPKLLCPNEDCWTKVELEPNVDVPNAG